MKKIKLSLITMMLLFVAANVSPLKSDAQGAVNFQVFYDNLAPYGNWVTYPGYGYVWAPNVAPGFRPYVTNGHWVYSDAGWVWASDYDWGWAVFHYGSWIDDPAYGWMWVPGYNWAPAWVTWGSYNGYYGWAPVAPGFAIGVAYYPPMDRWCFVEPQYMTVVGFGNHYYVAHNNRIVIGGGIVIGNERRITTVVNRADYGGHGYYAGPPRADFERVAHTTITPVSIRESTRPGEARVAGNAINIYRPNIKAGTKVYSRPAKAVSVDNLSTRQGVTHNATNRGGISNNAARPSSQQMHPAFQQPQGSRTNNNNRQAQPQSRGNNSAPTSRQPQHSAPTQQRANPAPNAQHQRAARPASAPQREQAPKQEAPREEGHPK